jgi:LacI family transcriptional regulator
VGRKSLQRQRPNQVDVARLAGVSQATVSYVLNENIAISLREETRQRIREAARMLGYVPNNTARSLRTNRTYTIASIIPDITNPFYPALERGIQDVAEQHGYNLIIYNTDGVAEKERRHLYSVQQARVDGVVACLFHATDRDFFPLLEQNIPVVQLGAEPKTVGAYSLDNLYPDNVAAAHAAISYLVGKGYGMVGMLAGHGGPGQARFKGYRRALADHGIAFDERLVTVDGFTEEGGYRAMVRLLAVTPRPRAVFAANDLMAMGALVAVKEAHLRVPQDVALMGFDDIPIAQLVSPPLSTVSLFQRQLGQRAATMLFERLNGKAPEKGRCEKMPYQLIVRESA